MNIHLFQHFYYNTLPVFCQLFVKRKKSRFPTENGIFKNFHKNIYNPTSARA